MKRIQILFPIMVFFFIYSCKEDKHQVMNTQLSRIVSNYLETHPETSILRLFFFHLGDMDFLSVHSSLIYDKNHTDAYFFMDSVLVTVSYADSINRDGIINSKHLTHFQDTILGYDDDFYHGENNEEIPILYVINNDRISIFQQDTVIGYKKASSNNVICNKELNQIINDYINHLEYVVYNVSFARHERKLYFKIEHDFFYDKDIADGYFMRDGHLVVLYGLANIRGTGIVNEDSVMRIGDGIPNFRHAKLREYFMPLNAFEIENNGSCRYLEGEESAFIF